MAPLCCCVYHNFPSLQAFGIHGHGDHLKGHVLPVCPLFATTVFCFQDVLLVHILC